MAATITVEKKEERSKLQKAKDFAFKYRYGILGGATAGVLYFLGFKSGWNTKAKVDLAIFNESLPVIVEKSGRLGAFSFYDWMAEKVPEALKLCDEFSDKHPELSNIRDYFMKNEEIMKTLEVCKK